jgi:hypothetical protein
MQKAHLVSLTKVRLDRTYPAASFRECLLTAHLSPRRKLGAFNAKDTKNATMRPVDSWSTKSDVTKKLIWYPGTGFFRKIGTVSAFMPKNPKNSAVKAESKASPSRNVKLTLHELMDDSM